MKAPGRAKPARTLGSARRPFHGDEKEAFTADRVPVVGGAVPGTPWSRALHGRTVYLQPFTDIGEALLLDRRYASVAGGADVEQQVAAPHDHVHQLVHQLGGGAMPSCSQPRGGGIFARTPWKS